MKKTEKNANKGISMGMCLGVAIGTSLGVAFDNISMGVGLGICIGLAVGFAMGSQKDKLVDKQVSEKGYTVKQIIPKDKREYIVIIEDKLGETKEIITPGGIMDTELFSVGDIVYLDEDGMLEQAFDKDNE
jgi:hypothetical protein